MNRFFLCRDYLLSPHPPGNSKPQGGPLISLTLPFPASAFRVRSDYHFPLCSQRALRWISVFPPFLTDPFFFVCLGGYLPVLRCWALPLQFRLSTFRPEDSVIFSLLESRASFADSLPRICMVLGPFPLPAVALRNPAHSFYSAYVRSIPYDVEGVSVSPILKLGLHVFLLVPLQQTGRFFPCRPEFFR